MIPATPDSSIDLREVTVRPTRGAREHRLWDRLVEEHHYLRFHGIIGKGLRHAACAMPRCTAGSGSRRSAGSRARSGLPRGFGREPGGAARFRQHGQPKEIFMYELTDGAAGALSRDAVPESWNAERHNSAGPMAASGLRSLFACLDEVPGRRRPRGRRYPLETVPAIAVAARPAGCRGVTAFARFAALLA